MSHSPPRNSKEERPAKRLRREDTEVVLQSLWKVGPHVSTAGGIENAITNALSVGANAFALFVKPHRRWDSPPLREESIQAFKDALKEHNYSPSLILPHGSYLVNLGNPDAEKRAKSYTCFLDDLKRCEQLGLELYNFHPGSTVGGSTPDASMACIAEAVNNAQEATSSIVILLETMAGAGNIIGSKLEDIAEIIKQVKNKERVGVCVDTCHSHAAGYDITTLEGWNNFCEEFDSKIGLKYLRAMHLNDSKTPCGSKKDRHENIGFGSLGALAFHHILRDPRTQGIPLILETPTNEHFDVWTKEVQLLNGLSELPLEGDTVEAQRNALVESVGASVAAAAKANPKPAKKAAKRKVKKAGQSSDEDEDED
ncbi:xylose isomerase-like protein [Flagelloscypha sp. PMI_526]|nr:xylose isomerase-like protein [Flagelloscypha sp. PMI_526]